MHYIDNYGSVLQTYATQTIIERYGYCCKVINYVRKNKRIMYEAKTLPNRFVRKYKKLPLLAWTVRSQEEYLKGDQ